MSVDHSLAFVSTAWSGKCEHGSMWYERLANIIYENNKISLTSYPDIARHKKNWCSIRNSIKPWPWRQSCQTSRGNNWNFIGLNRSLDDPKHVNMLLKLFIKVTAGHFSKNSAKVKFSVLSRHWPPVVFRYYYIRKRKSLWLRSVTLKSVEAEVDVKVKVGLLKRNVLQSCFKLLGIRFVCCESTVWYFRVLQQFYS